MKITPRDVTGNKNHVPLRKSEMRKPNLFLVGAQKSGTSSLFRYLTANPKIIACREKEPSYFVPKEKLSYWFPESWAYRYANGEKSYLNLFPVADEESFLCEASTLYTANPDIPNIAERIAAFNPEAKILYVMRDPVERTISHYWHDVIKKVQKQGLLEAIQSDHMYTSVSHYAMQLSPYIDMFGRDRVKAITSEELASDPASTLKDIFDWLGVRLDQEPTVPEGRYNVTPATVAMSRLPTGLTKIIRKSAFMRRATVGMRGRLGTLAPILFKEVEREAEKNQQVIAYLQSVQIKQVEELRQLLGRDFPEWKTLYGSRLDLLQPNFSFSKNRRGLHRKQCRA